MKTNTIYLEGILLNIYKDNEDEYSAWLKILSNNGFANIKVKGFWKTKNKNNDVTIGSFYNFEVFENYGSKSKKLLKKIHSKKVLKNELQQNHIFIQKLLWILQLIKEPNEELIKIYLAFLNQENNENAMWFLTYLFFKILLLQNQVNQTNYCIKCNSNQNIYAINFHEGIICFDDFNNIKNKNKWLLDKKILKSFYYINVSLDLYFQTTNAETNQKIYSILECLNNEN